MPELTITSPYIHSKVDLNTLSWGALGNPMPQWTVTLSLRVDFIPQSGTQDLASGNGFQHVHIVQLFYAPQKLQTRELTLIDVFLTLAGGEGQGALVYLVIKACKSRLLGRRPLSCEPLLIPASRGKGDLKVYALCFLILFGSKPPPSPLQLAPVQRFNDDICVCLLVFLFLPWNQLSLFLFALFFCCSFL